MPGSTTRARRALLGGAVVLFFLGLLGVTYQGVATAVERRQFPHPGRLVDIGGHQLHIDCVGTGSPTVVLESAAGGLSASWGWVFPGVAPLTRVCAYDRAGLGWSEAGDHSFDPTRVAPDLRTLLERTGEPPPYVIVGHGLGAAFARRFAAAYGSDVPAIVLVDEPDPGSEPERARRTRLIAASPWLARIGVLRATAVLSRRAEGVPGAAGSATKAFLNRPDHLTRAGAELAGSGDGFLRATAAQPLDAGTAVMSIDAGSREPLALIESSEQGMLVTRAISEVVEKVRKLP